jgi:hypothetical protein
MVVLVKIQIKENKFSPYSIEIIAVSLVIKIAHSNFKKIEKDQQE